MAFTNDTKTAKQTTGHQAKEFTSAAARDAWWQSESLKPHADLNTAQQVRELQRRARNLAYEVATLYENPSAFKTPAENARQLAGRFDKRKAELSSQLKRAREAAAAERKLAQSEVESLLPAKDTARGAEIRSYFRELNEADRHPLMRQAIEDGDAETLAALTSAPSYLAGLTADQQRNARSQFAQTHAPQASAQLTAIDKAESLANEAYAAAVDYGVQHYPADVLNNAERREEKRDAQLAEAGDGGDAA